MTSHVWCRYLSFNETQSEVKEVVAPLLDTIVSVTGGASNITFTGFSFTETRATYFEQYEVPSGGDWSIHRLVLFTCFRNKHTPLSFSLI